MPTKIRETVSVRSFRALLVSLGAASKQQKKKAVTHYKSVRKFKNLLSIHIHMKTTLILKDRKVCHEKRTEKKIAVVLERST